MIPLRGFSQHGFDAITAVHSALSAHAPELVAHFNSSVLEVHFAPQLCTRGSAACVRGDVHRIVLFSEAPEHMPLATLATVLLHEARHLQEEPRGGWTILLHSCSDAFCTCPSERASDAVYRGDVEVLPRIVEALRAAGWNPDLQWAPRLLDLGELLARAAVLGVAIFAGAAIGNRMTKRWDPSMKRYRGSNGQLRGAGIFD